MAKLMSLEFVKELNTAWNADPECVKGKLTGTFILKGGDQAPILIECKDGTWIETGRLASADEVSKPPVAPVGFLLTGAMEAWTESYQGKKDLLGQVLGGKLKLNIPTSGALKWAADFARWNKKYVAVKAEL